MYAYIRSIIQTIHNRVPLHGCFHKIIIISDVSAAIIPELPHIFHLEFHRNLSLVLRGKEGVRGDERERDGGREDGKTWRYAG